MTPPDHLPWRWLWRGVRPAMAPHRWGLCALVLLAVLGWSELIAAMVSPDRPGFVTDVIEQAGWVAGSIFDPDAITGAEAGGSIGIEAAALGELLTDRFIEAFVVGVPALVLAAMAVMIAGRSAVPEIAGSAARTRQLRSIVRPRLFSAPIAWGATVAVFAIAWAISWLIAGGIEPDASETGWLSATLRVLAACSGVVMIAAMLHAMLGVPLTTAIIGVERADAIEGTQRAGAYLVGRPVRTVLAWLVVLVGGVVLVRLFYWLGTEAGVVVDRLVDAHRTTPGGLRQASGVTLWAGLVRVGAGSLAISYAGTGSVTLYLWLRERIDGQDHTDVGDPDVPGMIDRASITPDPEPASESPPKPASDPPGSA